jgi:hypothetical protein
MTPIQKHLSEAHDHLHAWTAATQDDDTLSGAAHVDSAHEAIHRAMLAACIAPPAPTDRVTAEDLEWVAGLNPKYPMASDDDVHALMLASKKLAAEVTALRAERDGWKAEAEQAKRQADLRQVAREEADERADHADEQASALWHAIDTLTGDEADWREAVHDIETLGIDSAPLATIRDSVTTLRAEIETRNRIGEEVLEHFMSTPLVEDPEVVELRAKLEALREKARAVGKAARNDTREERASAPLREAIAVMLAEVDKP